MPQDELVAGLSGQPESIQPEALLAQVLDRANLQRALKQVRQNKGAPGIDGMTVDELPKYLRDHWLGIRAQLEAGSYQPQPVKRVDIPKPDGKPVPWAFPRCWTVSFSKPSRKSYRRNGNRIFTATATDFVRGARPIKPCVKCRRTSVQDSAGWWTRTCNPSLIKSITIG